MNNINPYQLLYYNQDYLMHHGVKGMKWGVRHERRNITRYTPRKGDVILKKGLKFQRIAADSNAGYTQGVYTSYRNNDKDLYKGVLGRMRVSYLMKEFGNVKLHEITMSSKRDIRIPSKEVRIEKFKELYKKNPEGVRNLINEHETTRYGRKALSSYDKYMTDASKTKTMYEKFNDAFAMGTNSKYGSVIKDYYNSLSKMGYDAIPDENDIRLSTFKADAPIIFFNTNKSISKTKSRELKAGEIFSAYNRSIGKKLVRDIIMRGNIGIENLKQNNRIENKMYNSQLKKDKTSLNKNYTMNDLGKDWGINRLTSNQIQKVSNLMDNGMSHDEAVKKVKHLGNSLLDKIMTKIGI